MFGLMFAFQKVNPRATLLQKLIAIAIGGKHFHVEVGIAEITDSSGGFHYLWPFNYTAFMGRGFVQVQNTGGRMNNQEWDFVFVPLHHNWQIEYSLQWLNNMRGR
eukprot:983250-Rhodomonas_salina.1